MNINAENRFSDRVENYIKFRPHYPQGVVDLLLQKNHFSANTTIADIGSGTGISAELFLKNNFKVIGVEPNNTMREAAEDILKEHPNFVSINANDINTALENNSLDGIIAAQAFHWFDKEKFKTECKRILKPNAQVALIWNDRKTEGNDFLKLYEEFLHMFSTEYAQVNHKNTQSAEVFDAFFGKACLPDRQGNYTEYTLDNYQDVDLFGLRGRVLSSSYMPNTESKEYEYMMYVLRKIYQRYQENNKVRLEYNTKIYVGTVN
jgi:ubiquinone/menaquinone biosynthesis C-methylase UbiE